MPTLMIVDGVRIMIYPNDHLPPHAHAVGSDGRARFILNCPDGPVELWDAKGFRRPELDRLGYAIARRLGDCCAVWDRMHG